MISSAMSHHDHGSHPCHLCDATPLNDAFVLEHILAAHWRQLHLNAELDRKTLLDMLLAALKLDFISKFTNLFVCY